MKSYFQKFIGEHAPLAAKASFKDIAFAWGGGFVAIALIGFLTHTLNHPLVLGSFGASCVLLFGNPKATRAVANANGKNPISILIPCHRVIASGGRLGGYSGGLWRKEFMLELEKKALS